MRKEESSSGAQISISARHYVITHMTLSDVEANNSVYNGERFYENSETFRILDEEYGIQDTFFYHRDIFTMQNNIETDRQIAI